VTEPLWKHQEQSIAFFKNVPCGFDNSSPGTGKTRVQIETYNNRPPTARPLADRLPEDADGERMAR
jgi:hypothetical protein